jgi:hypothetical protein
MFVVQKIDARPKTRRAVGDTARRIRQVGNDARKTQGATVQINDHTVSPGRIPR